MGGDVASCAHPTGAVGISAVSLAAIGFAVTSVLAGPTGAVATPRADARRIEVEGLHASQASIRWCGENQRRQPLAADLVHLDVLSLALRRTGMVHDLRTNTRRTYDLVRFAAADAMTGPVGMGAVSDSETSLRWGRARVRRREARLVLTAGPRGEGHHGERAPA